MKTLKTLTQLSTVLCLLGLSCTGKAQAEDISGTITVTKTIFEDSRLVGDVTCTMTDSPVSTSVHLISSCG